MAYLAVNCQTESSLLLLPPASTHKHGFSDLRINYRKRVNLNRLLTKLFTTFLPMQNNGYRVMGFSVEKRQSSQFERQPFKSAQLLSTSPSIPITAALIQNQADMAENHPLIVNLFPQTKLPMRQTLRPIQPKP